MKSTKSLRKEPMSLDLYWKELGGINRQECLKKADLRKCLAFCLLSIVRLCLFLWKEKRIRVFINVLAIELKIEEIHLYLQGN